MNILIINGANLNLLGLREKHLYGTGSYKDLVKFIKSCARLSRVHAKVVQSNSESRIIKWIHKARKYYDGIIINAGAFTHTSIAILDALRAVNLPTVEVHLTDISKREPYRSISYISEYAFKTICGEGFNSYRKAISLFKTAIKTK